MAATVPTEHKPSLLDAHIYTQYTLCTNVLYYAVAVIELRSGWKGYGQIDRWRDRNPYTIR